MQKQVTNWTFRLNHRFKIYENAVLKKIDKNVQIPADVKHWHGAAHDSWFVHLAVEVNPEKGPVEWLEPVADEDYNTLK